MLTDKEVGELWRQATRGSPHQWECGHDQEHIALIRRLIEECANSVKCDFGVCYGDRQTLESTLRRFTIDPKDWPND